MIRAFFLTLICFCFLMTGLACAGPFLVCDPYPEIVSYEVLIEENGVMVMGGIVAPEADTTLKFDLQGIPFGTYTAKVKAETMWGWSDWSIPLNFIAHECTPPTGLTIIP